MGMCLVFLLAATASQAAALPRAPAAADYPSVIASSTEDSLYDINYQTGGDGEYIVWSVNKTTTDLKPVFFARRSERFATVHKVAAGAGLSYNGGFSFVVNNKTGDTWMMFQSKDFSQTQSCNLDGEQCAKVYEMTPRVGANDTLNVALYDGDRALYTVYTRSDKLTRAYTTNFDGSSVYLLSTINTSILLGAFRIPGVPDSQPYHVILDRDVFTPPLLVSMELGAPAIAVGFGPSPTPPQFSTMIVGARANGRELLFAESDFSTFHELAAYTIDSSPTRSVACSVDVGSGEEKHFPSINGWFAVADTHLVNNWDSSPGTQTPKFAIFSCPREAHGAQAAVAAEGPGDFTTILQIPYGSARLANSTTVFTVSLDQPYSKPGTAHLVQFDAAGGSSTGGPVASVDIPFTSMAYGGFVVLESSQTDAQLTKQFAWMVTGGGGFVLSVFDSTTGKNYVVLSTNTSSLSRGGIQSTPSKFIWMQLGSSGGSSLRLLETDLSTLPPVTSHIHAWDDSFYPFFDEMEDGYVVGSGTVFSPSDAGETKAEYCEVIVVDTHETPSNLTVVQHLGPNHSYSASSPRFNSEAALYTWASTSYEDSTNVVYSLPKPYTDPASVYERVEVLGLKSYSTEVVEGCLLYFANNSTKPWSNPNGWSIGLVGATLGSKCVAQ